MILLSAEHVAVFFEKVGTQRLMVAPVWTGTVASYSGTSKNVSGSEVRLSPEHLAGALLVPLEDTTAPAYLPLRHPDENASPEAFFALLERLRARLVVVPNIFTARHAFRQPLTIEGDLVATGRALQRQTGILQLYAPETTGVHTPAWAQCIRTDSAVLRSVAEDLRPKDSPTSMIVQLTLQAMIWLTDQSAVGYERVDYGKDGRFGLEVRTVHPVWSVNALGGLTSSDPALGSVKKLERKAYVTPHGWRWISLSWPQSLLRMAAALSADPKLLDVVRAADPWVAFAEAIGVVYTDEHRAPLKAVAFKWLSHGGLPRDFVDDPAKCGLCDRMAEAFPVLAHFFKDTDEQLSSAGEITTWMLRRYRRQGGETTPAATATLQQSLNTAFLVMLSRLRSLTMFEPMSQIRQVIPVMQSVSFMVRDEVPVADYVRLLQTSVPVKLSADVTLVPEVYMGPSWGDLTRVDHQFGQVEMDLQTVNKPYICPHCEARTWDAETMAKHLLEGSCQALGEPSL